jgi:hypothetical protein
VAGYDGIEEEAGRGAPVVGLLKLTEALLEARDVLAHELGAGLALAVVEVALVALLCADALLAGRLGTVASLA